jgi:hypothetical protein
VVHDFAFQREDPYFVPPLLLLFPFLLCYYALNRHGYGDIAPLVQMSLVWKVEWKVTKKLGMIAQVGPPHPNSLFLQLAHDIDDS